MNRLRRNLKKSVSRYPMKKKKSSSRSVIIIASCHCSMFSFDEMSVGLKKKKKQ